MTDAKSWLDIISKLVPVGVITAISGYFVRMFQTERRDLAQRWSPPSRIQSQSQSGSWRGSTAGGLPKAAGGGSYFSKLARVPLPDANFLNE